MRHTPILALVLVLAACGPADSSGTSAPDPAATTVYTTVASTTAVAPGPDPTTETTVEDESIQIVFRQGAVVGGQVTIEVAVGARVEMVVTSDVDDQVHVHGFDRFFDLEAGVPTDVVFVAAAPGVYEIEMEESHTLIALLVVG